MTVMKPIYKRRKYDDPPTEQSYYYCQKGDSTTSTIEEWRFPDWIRPGMMVELTGKFALGKMQKVDSKGVVRGLSRSLDRTVMVLVTKLTDNRGYLDGLCGEDLFRFSGKMEVTQAKEGSLLVSSSLSW